MKAFGAILLLALAACTNVPVTPPAPQLQSACANGAEATYACQVERYNAVGTW